MATALAHTKPRTAARDFTADDWYSLPREHDTLAGNPDEWAVSVDLTFGDGGIIGLAADSAAPVPVVDIPVIEMNAADVRSLTETLAHLANVIEDIAARETLIETRTPTRER